VNRADCIEYGNDGEDHDDDFCSGTSGTFDHHGRGAWRRSARPGKKIPLGDVAGRIDHMAVNVAHRRQRRHAHVAVRAELDRLYVPCGRAATSQGRSGYSDPFPEEAQL
jgi:hypothetical protein